MELKINKVLYQVSEPGELHLCLAQVRCSQFSEVWMQHPDSWPSICALINGEAAWPMFLRFEGDAGFPAAKENLPKLFKNSELPTKRLTPICRGSFIR